MVKIKTKVKICFISAVSIVTGIYAGVVSEFRTSAATVTCSASSSSTCTNSATTNGYGASITDVPFTANVVESLSVSINETSTWAKGNINTFMRDKISIVIKANNSNGYTASMYSNSTTDLTNVSVAESTIPTLAASSARSDFPVNHWGYSLNDTDSGLNSSTYSSMTTSSAPIVISSSLVPVESVTKNIYFGAKADMTKASGTYTNDVIINVVTGYTANPTVPSNPSTPDDDTDQEDHYATYNPSTGNSVYVDPDDTNSTTVIEGNYTAPLGVTESTSYTSSIASGSSLAVGLAVASVTAATTGFLFFVLAKRRNDDDEEDEY